MYRFILRNPNRNLIQRNLINQKRRFSSQGHYPQEAGFGKLLLFLAPVAATGGVIAYAKYDNEFRKTLVNNVPGADAVLKLVLQEQKPFEGLTKKVEKVTSTVTGFFGGESEKKVDVSSSMPKRLDKSDANSTQSTKPDTVMKVTQTSKQEQVERPAAPVQVTKILESIPQEISELERAVEVSLGVALQEYNKAINVLNSYNEEVKNIIDQAVEKVDLTSWTTLKNKTGARDSAVETAENSARNAIQKIEECERALSKVALTIDHDKLQAVRRKIKHASDHINNVKDELYKAKDKACFSEKYWKKVESARNYFINEIESIFPGINLSEKKLNLSKDDIDLFILHAYSHVLAYQKELQRLQLDGELRLKRAIEALKGEDQDEAVKAQVDFYLEREKRNIALENQKKIFQIKAEAENELRKQLKRQAEAHIDHIHDALSQKEAELKRTFSRELDEKLSSEKASYKLQLASMLGKLKGMDAALKARAESERCAHQAQSLWAACQALWASVRTGEPGVHWHHKLRPLKNEIMAVSMAAAEGDELVAVVLQNLPQEAQIRGVYPEDALRERFINVEKVARKLALVPEEGASLPVYLLSYIQSFFILRPDEPISHEELQNKQIDFSKLDTYDILDRARYFLDRGDLTQALKYMNLLQGASRKIASDWLKEARLLLETQQAANTLMAHAAASGLLYL